MHMMDGGIGSRHKKGSAVGWVGDGSMADRVAAHHSYAGRLDSHAVAVAGVGVAVACRAVAGGIVPLPPRPS